MSDPPLWNGSDARRSEAQPGEEEKEALRQDADRPHIYRRYRQRHLRLQSHSLAAHVLPLPAISSERKPR